ncbi:MAG: histidine phosphatase family protein [Eggerthella lenta]
MFRVITSGMARTDQTARILFPNAELMACPGLREMDFGDFEAKRRRT